jgi:hypothetical protein
MRLTALCAPVLLAAAAALAAPTVSTFPVFSGDLSKVRVMVLVSGEEPGVKPEFSAHSARITGVSTPPNQGGGASGTLYMVDLARDPQIRSATFNTRLGEAETTCALPAAMDLSVLPWESHHVGEKLRYEDIGAPPGDDAAWKPAQVPETIQEVGVTWLRVRMDIPESLSDTPLRVHIAAVDDNDVTFFNGTRIGATTGWDKLREYAVPPEAVFWGESNTLCVAVHNQSWGGGIYRTPVLLIAGEKTELPQRYFDLPKQKETDRAPAGTVAPRPKPLQPLHVEGGVLHYPDGTEPALWGVNYYTQSWGQYESLRKAGVDHKQAIIDDFDDLVRMNIDIVRIHVFDREVSDGDGNLVPNEHLDLLDRIVAECDKRGIYLMLTPIAWWSGPNQRPGSFSLETPKQSMGLWPERWPAQANYLRQFLAHKNPHTGNRLVDEPCLALFEIINEPDYWTLEQMRKRDPGNAYGEDPACNLRGLDGARAAWERFAPDPAWRTGEMYAWFRYDTVRRYIDTMVGAMRDTGAKQPVAYFRTWWSNNPDIVRAIADSRAEAITIGNYPGALPATPVNDAKNLLAETKDWDLEQCLAQKARLVYEFDAAGSLHQISSYPALARQFRGLGVQAANQFQYDARAVAAWNPDWPQHYLNLRHTPERAVSHMIAGELFRRLPRGTRMDLPTDDVVCPPGAFSFAKNAALLCAPDCYMQARPTDWRPMELPENPKKIVSVGSCPYFDYDGTGVVFLEVNSNKAKLTVYADVDRLREDLTGTAEAPLTKLVEREHLFRMKMKGWEKTKAVGTTDRRAFPVKDQGWLVKPGEYELTR